MDLVSPQALLLPSRHSTRLGGSGDSRLPPGFEVPGTRQMKGRTVEAKRIPMCADKSWWSWMNKLIEALTDRGTMSFPDVFAWGRQRGKNQDWCRHLLAYSDDRITLIPGKLWCLKTRENAIMGARKTG